MEFLNDIQGEEFKPIRDAPNYMISNYGRVVSIGRDYKYGNHDDMFLKLSDRRGYKKATLFVDGKRYYKAVHRLVAEAFIPNPNNYPCVNHKDEDRANNVVTNLEWCTHLYNSHYGNCRVKISKRVSRKVEQLTKDGIVIKAWDSMTKAGETLGIAISEISKCCKNYKFSAGGYKWRKI